MTAPNDSRNRNIIWISLAATAMVGTILIAVALITLKNLGSTERSAAEQAYIDQMIAEAQTSVPRDENLCFYGTMVDEIGISPMKAAGMTVENMASDAAWDLFELPGMTPTQREVVAEAFTRCIDIENVAVNSATDGPKNQEALDCYRSVDWDAVSEEYYDLITNDGEIDADDTAFDRVAQCRAIE